MSKLITALRNMDISHEEFLDAKRQIGKAIRTERKLRGLTLRKFAQSLGISPAYLSDLELGHRNPGKGILERIMFKFDLGAIPIKNFPN